MEIYAIKGDICYSKDIHKIVVSKDSYVVCKDGLCAGVYKILPKCYKMVPCYDYSGKLVIPGLVDIHMHAPQYTFRGLGMDMELIDWLNTHTFVEEAKYEDEEYSNKAYDIFVEDLKYSATTRACIFGTIHHKATSELMKKLENAGMCGYVGKVNMDRNSPEYLCEKSVNQAVEDTKKWIEEVKDLKHIKPILTPRFIPTCSDKLMESLSEIQKENKLPVQSHLSENIGEIEWVKELCPDTNFYGEAYYKYNMFGGDCPTIMAHCVHSNDDEIELMKKQNVFVAYCPESNTNLSSGIAPIRTYIEKGLKIGLGSDIAAGSTLSIFNAMAMAIQCSKLRWRLVDQSLLPLNIDEAFYLGTKGGGEFFGKVGSFEEGYEFDAVVIDDTSIKSARELELKERLERYIYLAQDQYIIAKFVAGNKVFGK